MTGHSSIERSCARLASDWVRTRQLDDGMELLQARFAGRGFDSHRHDTYAIGVTDAGIQTFGYRGETVSSTPGQAVVLHPDEVHDGRAGDETGFEYRIVYLCPMRVFEATKTLSGGLHSLPFVPGGVCSSSMIASTLDRAFAEEAVPLACDALTLDLVQALLEAERGAPLPIRKSSVDVPALERARQLLDTELYRPVSSQEIEAVTGLSRFECARQFRIRHGTSPYRYSLLRRLDAVRRVLPQSASIAATATQFGFSDQAHLSRHFRATFGLTPLRYRRLRSVADL